jgi:hypothetical protein
VENTKSIIVVKIFMFSFVGGLVGLVQYFAGISPSLIPVAILLGGLGAVAAVQIFVRPRDDD